MAAMIRRSSTNRQTTSSNCRPTCSVFPPIVFLRSGPPAAPWLVGMHNPREPPEKRARSSNEAPPPEPVATLSGCIPDTPQGEELARVLQQQEVNHEESSEMSAMFPRPLRGPLAMAEAADEASELMRMMSTTRYSEMGDEEIMRDILESGAPPAQGDPARRLLLGDSAAAIEEFNRRRTSRRNGYILGKLMDISTEIDNAYGDLLMLGEPATHADVQWSRVLQGIGTFLRQAGMLTGAAYQAIEARERDAYHEREARRRAERESCSWKRQ